jgi:hypothetical protein
MQTIRFNTGRGYTDKGQRVAAALLDNGDIYFVDVDRGIDGTIRSNGLMKDDMLDLGLFTQRSIMAAYDNGEYAWTSVPEGLRADLTAVASSL